MENKEKMKVLYIVTQSEWGGAGKYVYDLSEHLSKESFDVHVASGRSKTSELRNKLKTKRIPVYPLSFVQRSINPLSDLRGCIEIYKLIKLVKPDIVHLNSSKVSVIGSIAAYAAGVSQIVYTAHGWVFNEPNSWLKNTFYYLSELVTAPLKTDIICVSEFDKAVAVKRNIKPRKKLVAIHNGIDTEKLHFYDKDTARELLSEKMNVTFPLHKPVIGTIGNLYKTKGHDVLIKALKKLPNYTCIILGEGPQRKALEEQITKMNLKDRVFIPGALTNGYQYLKAFDVFVLPSVKEGFPYIILEALAAKIPMIATRVGGIPEIVPSEYLVTPRSAEVLTQTLSDNPTNPLVENEKIDIKGMIEKTASLYNQSV